MMRGVKTFLKLLRDSDRYITDIYSKGSCYHLYKILKHLYPEAEPYMCGTHNNTLHKDAFIHVVTKIGNAFYDINGEFIPGPRFPLVIPLTEEEEQVFKEQSFAKMQFLLDCETCPYQE